MDKSEVSSQKLEVTVRLSSSWLAHHAPGNF
jgi:hypothetical protein